MNEDRIIKTAVMPKDITIGRYMLSLSAVAARSSIFLDNNTVGLYFSTPSIRLMRVKKTENTPVKKRVG
jgi:hypothetical protein